MKKENFTTPRTSIEEVSGAIDFVLDFFENAKADTVCFDPEKGYAYGINSANVSGDQRGHEMVSLDSVRARELILLSLKNGFTYGIHHKNENLFPE